MRRTRVGAAFVILLSALLVPSASPALVGQPGGDPTGSPEPSLPPVVDADDVALVAFDSCDGALAAFRRAALDQVGPYGLPGAGPRPIAIASPVAAAPQRAVPDAAESVPRQTPGHSSTTSYEADADEPDLVKTDGRRIVSVLDGTLRVVDVVTQRLTASVRLPDGHASDLLVHGDRALVFIGTGELGPLPGAPTIALLAPLVPLVPLTPWVPRWRWST